MDILTFTNPDGTKIQIERGGSGFLDKSGFMHNADEISDLFDYDDNQLSDMGIEITFLGDELTDFYNCDGSLEKYINYLKQFQ